MKFRDAVHAVENKYNRLLAILILVYLTSPILLDRALGNVIVLFGFFGATIFAIYQIEQNKKILRVNIGLVVITLLLVSLSRAAFVSQSLFRIFDISATAVYLVFLALSTLLILLELINAHQITSDTIKGGICVFFLFGFFWTSLYVLLYGFDPNAFSGPSDPLTRADLIHFSFTTLTTVGYGDVVPRSDIARVLANLEGMVGVMYPAVFIARLVGLSSTR